jgi:hypothetical protein
MLKIYRVKTETATWRLSERDGYDVMNFESVRDEARAKGDDRHCHIGVRIPFSANRSCEPQLSLKEFHVVNAAVLLELAVSIAKEGARWICETPGETVEEKFKASPEGDAK